MTATFIERHEATDPEKSRPASNGPITARVGATSNTSEATSRTSSSVTSAIAAEHLVEREHLAVDELTLADAVHARAGVLHAENERSAQLALAALQLFER